jgi:hypothetical protein
MTLLATILAAVVLIDGAVAAVPEPSCDVPQSFLASDNDLGRVLKEVKSRQRLDIVVLGTGSSSLPGPDGAHFAYPVQLEQALQKELPGVAVKVTAHVEPRATTEEMTKDLPKILTDDQPSLVIWQAGTADAMTGVEPEEFHNSLDDGVTTIENGDADVILMNMQYSPHTEAMMDVSGYADIMHFVAQQHNALLFDRLAIMRNWNDSGTFDLYAATKNYDMARDVHECIGRALASQIVSASHLDAMRIQTTR